LQLLIAVLINKFGIGFGDCFVLGHQRLKALRIYANEDPPAVLCVANPLDDLTLLESVQDV
jgi:hypothetical protein